MMGFVFLRSLQLGGHHVRTEAAGHGAHQISSQVNTRFSLDTIDSIAVSFFSMA
jgi:hypothetical protein